MRDGVEGLHQRADAALGEHEGIAACQNDLPDGGCGANVVECGCQFGVGEVVAGIGSDHFAAETEAAVDRADAHDLQEHAVGVAVHEAGYRALGVIADRVGVFSSVGDEFGGAGNELAGDRVGRIIRLDQG